MKWILVGWLLVGNTWTELPYTEEFNSWGECKQRADYWYYLLSEYPYKFDCENR